jgi:hypothetical protein
MTSFSVFPGALDGYATLPLRRDGVHEIVADDYNRLRDAIIKVEQELGVEPSGIFATVRARLDSVGDASALIESHLVDPIDAHDASAISVLDTAGNYVSAEVEGALGELASILPVNLDVIGANDLSIPNSGISSIIFQNNTPAVGTLHVFNTAGGANDLKKTQPSEITGVHIIEVGESNGNGVATLQFTLATSSLQWTAPGDSAGLAVDISSLSTGDIVTLSSNTTTKKIRIARGSASLPLGNRTDTFDLLRFDAASGSFSINTVGIQSTNNITRTAISSTGTNRNQFMAGGIVFPADRGTLVLQKKTRAAADQFTPIAVLDLAANFDETKRATSQPVYVPALQNFDTITLFDRLPARKDYETLANDSDGNQVYDNFNLEATFSSFQVAKYLIPISNSDIAVKGALSPPTDTTKAEIDSKIAAYRLVHYVDGITNFNGEPAAANIFSISDALAAADNGDNTVRISNLYVDSDSARPSIEQVILRPALDAEVTSKKVSGVSYYNDSNDIFDVEVKSNTDVFSNTYLESDILRFTTDVFNFTGEDDGYGLNVDLDKLRDDGYVLFSDLNLPVFADRAFYLLNQTFGDGYRLTPQTNSFSTNGNISAIMHDPFGPSPAFDAYGLLTPSGTTVRLLVNSFSTTRATNTKEWFTDESRRVGVAETFSFNLDATQFTGAGSNGTLSGHDPFDPLVSGDLQCGGLFSIPNVNLPGLIYPQDDYDTTAGALVRPVQIASTDYSAFSGEAKYHRLFNLGSTTNGGKLRIMSSGSSLVSFNDFDESNASRSIRIRVKVPGLNGTGFMDIGKLFETGLTADNDGALSGPVTGQAGDLVVPFTFGIINNADTGNMIAVEIVYAPGGASLATAQLKIISSIELLEP